MTGSSFSVPWKCNRGTLFSSNVSVTLFVS